MPEQPLGQDQELVIGNAWLERRLITQIGKPCLTGAFLNKTTGRNYARPLCREFSFVVEEQEITGNECEFVNAETMTTDGVTEHVIHLIARQFALAVEMHLQVFARHPVIRKWLCIRNTGAKTVTLSDLNWEDVNLLVDTPATAEVWADYFTRRDKSVVVTMDDCALLINDVERHEGFIIASEAPGPLKRMEAYAHQARIAVGYNRDDETIFECLLAPGEEFRTPASFILTFANPIPQDVVDNVYGRFVEEHLTACDVSRVPGSTVNTWLPFATNIHRELVLEQIERAAELGVEAYQIDDGWFDHRGDWNDDLTKFPNGLEEIVDLAHARGIRFGLWMAVATADEASKVYREHPEWTALARDGTPNRHSVPDAVTMCLDSAYYDYILAKMDAVITRLRVELLKLDLSAVRNLYEPGKYPGCYATNHAHHSPRASHTRIMARLFDLVRILKARHPDCLIDVSYELYGVMDGTDLALTRVADQNWFTNIASPNEVNLRREIYQRGRVTRPWTLNFGGTLLDHPDAPRYGFISTLASHALFWGDLAQLDDATCAYYKKWFEWIKTQRAYSDFYRYYQVSDVFPVPDGLSSRDFRHAVPTSRYGIAPWGIHPPAFAPEARPAGEWWDGVARLDPHGEGPIFIFRPANSRDERFQLRIPWVEREARYLVQDASEERELGVFDGADLVERGLEVEISEAPGARVIVLRRERQTRV